MGKHELKNTRRKASWFIISTLALGVIIIIFAFMAEAAQKRGDNRLDDQSQSQSEIQKEIDKLDWITPMFLTVNPYSRPGTKLSEVNDIVIHYIGNPGTTAVQNRNYFENLSQTNETYASSNFIVCLDGTIVQCIPVDEVAYASNIRNDDTLSIEVCHPDDTGEFARESYAAVIRLTAWLCNQYGLTSSNVIRHYDVQGKECPRYYVVNEDAWETLKSDVAAAIG